MILRVHLRTEGEYARELRSAGYSLRPLPFGFSALIHAGVLALVAFGPPPQFGEPEESKSLYQIAIAPNKKKIIWYRLQDTLPPVTPAHQPAAEGDVTRGRLQSFQQAIVSKPKNAPPGRQLIWQPAPKLRLEEELKSPNLIALQGPPLPAGPVEKTKPKVFVPPRAKSDNLRQNPTLPAPSVDVGAPQLAVAAPGLQLAAKPKARTFQAPVRREAKVTIPQLIDSAPEAGVSIGNAGLGNRGQEIIDQGVMSALLIKPKARTFQAPSNGNGAGKSPGNGNGALIDAGTGDQLSAAIVGLNPTDRLAGLLPQGALATEFSRAPVPGEPVMGGPGGSGVKIPDLMVAGGGRTASAPPVVAPGSSKPVYLETVLAPPSSTLSVPLRPSSRTIPSAIEARFGRRLVYTMVIPVNLSAYNADWILWFAEREPQPGDNPQVRAPLPAKKLESLSGPLPVVGQEESRIQMAATIHKDGRVDGITIVRGRHPGLYQRAIEDLQSWQFHPATHNGMPVDVEVVVEIPFRLPPQMVSR